MTKFEEFKRNVRQAEAIGIVRFSKPMTDFDLAVQWAVTKVGKKKGGYPCDMTADEIYAEMPEEFKGERDE